MYEHVIILSRHRTALSYYQGTTTIYILDTYTYYQGTTIYIVYIHIINTLLYMNKLFQFIHIMKFFRLFFQSRGRMTTVFVVFLLCCAGTSHFIRGWAVRILFGIFPRIAPFVKKFHSMRKFYKEGQGVLKWDPLPLLVKPIHQKEAKLVTFFSIFNNKTTLF